jgi:hypothetical protein
VLGAGPRRSRDGRAPLRYPVLEVLEVLLGASVGLVLGVLEVLEVLLFPLENLETTQGVA